MRTKQLLQRQLQAAGAASEERQPSSGLPGSWAQQQSTIEQQKQQAPGHLLPRASAAAAAAAAPALAFAGAADGRALIGSSSDAAPLCSPVVHDSQLQPICDEQLALHDAAAAPAVPRPGWKPGLALRDPRRQPQQRQQPAIPGSQPPQQQLQHQQPAPQPEQQPAHKRPRLALPVMPPLAPLPPSQRFQPSTGPAPASSHQAAFTQHEGGCGAADPAPSAAAQPTVGQPQSECTAAAHNFLAWLESQPLQVASPEACNTWAAANGVPQTTLRMAQTWLVQQNRLSCTKVASPTGVRWVWGPISASAGTAAAGAALTAAAEAAAGAPQAAPMQPVLQPAAAAQLAGAGTAGSTSAGGAAGAAGPAAATNKRKAQPRSKAAAGLAQAAAPAPAAPVFPAAAGVPVCLPLGGVIHVRCFGCARFFPAADFQEHTKRCPQAGVIIVNLRGWPGQASQPLPKSLTPSVANRRRSHVVPLRASSGSTDPSRACDGRAAGSGGSSSSSSTVEHAATASSSSNGALLEGSAGGGGSGGGSAPQAASVAPSSPAAQQPGTNWLSGRNIALGGSVATVLLLTVFRKEIAPFVRWLVIQTSSLTDKSVIGEWSIESIATCIAVALTLWWTFAERMKLDSLEAAIEAREAATEARVLALEQQFAAKEAALEARIAALEGRLAGGQAAPKGVQRAQEAGQARLEWEWNEEERKVVQPVNGRRAAP